MSREEAKETKMGGGTNSFAFAVFATLAGPNRFTLQPVGDVVVLMPPYCSTPAQVRQMVEVLGMSREEAKETKMGGGTNSFAFAVFATLAGPNWFTLQPVGDVVVLMPLYCAMPALKRQMEKVE